MQNETLKTIRARRSCRAYQNRQITPAELQTVLEAGTWAATGMGRQSPVIVAVQDPQAIAELSRMNAAVMGTDRDPFYGAPTLLVVLADQNSHTCVEDGSLVIGNMMLAAESIGLASCWVHRAKEVFATERGRQLLKAWGVPGAEHLVGVGNCILGYAAEGGVRPAAPRKEGYIIQVKR